MIERTRITHPLTGRPFYIGRQTSIHSTFVPQHLGVGEHRTDEIIRDRLMRKSYRPRSRQASTNPHMLRRLFRMYDKDNSGDLDITEFLKLLKDIGIQAVSEEDCRTVFNQYDKNGDGTISYKEWCNIHCKHFTDVTNNLLNVPSLRLDVKHSSMTNEEAMQDLCNTLCNVTEKVICLETLLQCTTIADKSEVKQRLLDVGVGIGNEFALQNLLQQSKYDEKHVSLDILYTIAKTIAKTHSKKKPLPPQKQKIFSKQPFHRKMRHIRL